MKKYTYLLGILYLCGFLVACAGGNGGTEANVADTTAVTTTTPEPNTPTPTPTSEMSADESKQAVEEGTKLAKQIRDAYAKMKDKQSRYVEEVPLTSFLGREVEAAEFEITKVDANLTQVYVDYFDGSPTGGKRYFINNGELVAVEIVRLAEVHGEKVNEVQEKVSHTFYYKNGKLAQILDNQTQEVVDPKTITWANENLEHWEVVKKNL